MNDMNMELNKLMNDKLDSMPGKEVGIWRMQVEITFGDQENPKKENREILIIYVPKIPHK